MLFTVNGMAADAQGDAFNVLVWIRAFLRACPSFHGGLAFGLLAAPQGGMHAVAQHGRQHFGPFLDGLGGDAAGAGDFRIGAAE